MTKTVFRVTWVTENGSGSLGPFDGPDEAAREAQALLRADFRRVVTITPHEVAA